ncbi:unnamed protein product [Arabis nemorensis]|uniref:Uncharacterized protein n=1 Tax=Arabis nemorensis TaxID=586526 RepID=A0A565BC48_9BRAS|nr:unnamed protein product [Arabis nemorensis]
MVVRDQGEKVADGTQMEDGFTMVCPSGRRTRATKDHVGFAAGASGESGWVRIWRVGRIWKEYLRQGRIRKMLTRNFNCRKGRMLNKEVLFGLEVMPIRG